MWHYKKKKTRQHEEYIHFLLNNLIRTAVDTRHKEANNKAVEAETNADNVLTTSLRLISRSRDNQPETFTKLFTQDWQAIGRMTMVACSRLRFFTAT